MTLTDTVKSVEEIFQSLDVEVSAFKNWSGLSCASGCGKCCTKPDIEATVLEFLPLAYNLFKTEGYTPELYAHVIDEGDSLCALHDKTRSMGMCKNYTYRGMICRLFGYSARINRLNQAELITCSIIKTEQATPYQQAAVLIQVGDRTVPIMAKYYMQLLALDPELGKTLYPVNTAIRKAIEHVMHYYSYRESTED